jgi:hypothetical protein
MNAKAPTGAAIPAASDKYHVYRPMLDLIGFAEGTDGPINSPVRM